MLCYLMLSRRNAIHLGLEKLFSSLCNIKLVSVDFIKPGSLSQPNVYILSDAMIVFRGNATLLSPNDFIRYSDHSLL